MGHHRALWRACEQLAAQQGTGSRLHRQRVGSLAALQDSDGPFDAIIIAAGAAAGVLPEVGALCPDWCRAFLLLCGVT